MRKGHSEYAEHETMAKLKERMHERYGTLRKAGEALGVPYTTLLAKLSGRTYTKNAEAYKWLTEINGWSQ